MPDGEAIGDGIAIDVANPWDNKTFLDYTAENGFLDIFKNLLKTEGAIVEM